MSWNESVANFLVSKGIDRNRITTVGNGFNQPVADNATPDGRSKTRRVEIFIAANEKMIQQAQEGNLR